MSDSNRGERNPSVGGDLKFLVAILLTLGVGLGLGYLEGYQAERHQNSSRDYAEEAKRNAVVACRDLEPGAVADCVYNEINSSREAAQSEQDLQAQQWMARWAALLTLITLGTTVISWIALRYLRDTFRETSKGARAAAEATDAMLEGNKIARAAQRAWVALEVAPKLVRDGGGGDLHLRVNFHAENKGGSFATGFILEHAVFFKGQDEQGERVDKRMDAKIEEWKRAYSSSDKSVLLPKDRETSSIWQTYSSEEVRWWTNIPVSEMAAAPMLLAAVFYRTVDRPDLIQCSSRSWYLHTFTWDGQIQTLLHIEQLDLTEDQLCVEPFRTNMTHEQYRANDGNRHREDD